MNTQLLKKVAAAMLPLGLGATYVQPIGAYGGSPSYLPSTRDLNSPPFSPLDLFTPHLTGTDNANVEGYSASKQFTNSSLHKTKVMDSQGSLFIDLASSSESGKVGQVTEHQPVADLELVALSATSELVIIDAALTDKHAFYQKSKPGVKVAEIQFGEDALTQLKTVLKDHRNLDAIHLVSHADSGVILLGETRITEQLLREEIETLSSLDNALKPDGDLLLYGCNLADGEKGESLLELIALEANVDIAASNNLTGSEALNGDWQLEISRGSIDAELPFSAAALKDFSDVLVVANGLKDFSGWAGTNSTTLSTTDFSMTGSDGTTNILKIIGTDAYLTNIGANTGSFMYLQVDGVNTGSFELTGLVFDETANASAGVTNIYIKGYVSGGGTVTSSTLSGTAGADTFTFAAGQLGSFSGQQLTGFKVFFDATLTDYGSFKSFTVANAAAANAAPVLTGAPANATVTEDVATDVNLSAITVFDADGDSLTLTLTANAGTMAATSGGSVTVGGSGTGTMTLAGTAANINTFLDNFTNIKYTTSSNDNTARNIAAKVNDGTVDSATSNITVNITAVGDTPSITNATTDEDTQSTSGLVVSRNAADSTEVTHFKITSISGGSLFKNDGSTAIANNDFITFAEANAGLKFTPTVNSNSNGSFDVQAGTDNVGGGLSVGSASATITITAVNDAPTFAGVTNAGPTFAKGSSTAIQLDADTTVSDTELDVSDDFSGATITLVRNGGANAEDVMSVQTAGSLTVAGGNISSGGNVIATINSATPGQIVITFANNGTVPSGALVDEVIQNLTYKNTNTVNPGTLVRINYAFSDGNAGSQGTGGALTDSDDFVNVSIANAPTFTNLNGGATFTEGGSAVVIDTDASVADVELDALNSAAGDWTGAVLTIRRNGGVNSDDVLAMQAGGGITISTTNIQTAGLPIATFDTVSTAGEMVIAFTGTGATPTTALVQDVLNNITYSNSSDTPPTSISLDVIASDGTNSSTGIATVNITGVNDSPVFIGVDATPAFTEDGASIVLDANATISDAELDSVNNYNGAMLQLQRNGGANADDIFSNSGTLTVLTQGGTFNVGGLALGTVTTNSGGTLLLTFSTNATAVDVDAVIQQISYANNDDTPAANVQINYYFSDGNTGAQGTGGAGVDSNDSITVSIAATNDAPAFAGLDATPLFSRGGPPVILDANATVVDPELDAANSYNGATLTLIRNGGASANDVFSNTGNLSTLIQGNSFNVGGAAIGTVTQNSAGTLLLTFNAASTATDVDTVLQSIAYSNTNSSPPANVLIDYAVNDGTTIAQGAGGAKWGNGSINVTIQANIAPVITQPSPQELSVTEDGSNSITLDATDANGDPISWSISTAAANGTAAVSGIGASKAVSYTPTTNFNGADSLVVQVSDGKGGMDNLLVNMTVNAVGDTPGITNANTDEDVQTTSGLVISKSGNDGAEVTHYKITGLTGGSLFKNDGTTPIANNSFITDVEGAAGLKFTPTANSTADGSFDVQAGTDGVGGGLSAGSATAMITVDAVGDTPGITNASTDEDVQTTSGLVISKSGNDGAEVTHYKITGLTGGSLFKNDGTTPIANNSFITDVEGAAGLKFTPTANSTADGSFDVQAGTDGVGGGLSTDSATATISVIAVNDAPTFAGVSPVGPVFEKGSSTAVVLDADATIADLELDELDDFTGASMIFVRNGGADPEDVLSVQDGGSLLIAGLTISSGGNVIATIDDTSLPGQIAITFVNNGTIPSGALVDEVLQNVSYLSSDAAFPGTLVRIDYTFSDGNTGSQGTGGELSDNDDFVNVTFNNLAPVASSLTINGTALLGQTLTGSYVYSDIENDVEDIGNTGSSYRFVLSADSSIATTGDNIEAATGTTGGTIHTYKVQASDLRKFLFYCVTPKAVTGTLPGLEVCSVAVLTTVVAIPSLSGWGLMMLAGLIGFLGIAGIRRRGLRSSVSNQ